MSASDHLAAVDAITQKYVRLPKGPIEKRTPVKCKGAGKLKYETRSKAERCARALQAAFNEPILQRAYKCPYSGNPNKPHWHLTSQQAPIPKYVLLGGRRITVHCGPSAHLPERER